MLPVLALLQISQTLIQLPAFTGYIVGDSHGATLSDDGRITSWTSPETKIEWGGYLSKPGSIRVGLKLNLPLSEVAKYDLSLSLHEASAPQEAFAPAPIRSTRLKAVVSGKSGSVVADFGTIEVDKPEWVTFVIHGAARSGSTFGDALALQLEGSALQDAKFNLKPRRNAASVHLWYPAGDDTEWFYNEVYAMEDPLATYYMACGFSRGYFGMQVNGPNERRVIFSVWDSGKEAVDRSKVDPSNQVRLLAKGPGVVASGFGNEGTGGHSHLVYPWKTNKTQKFIVHAEPQGDRTVYTAYFWDAIDSRWRLIASFSAPHDGHKLTGLYSFVEDFDGDNGYLLRKALYGPAWVYSAARGWEQLATARFTYDGTGGKDRFDYDFGANANQFLLQNGGFTGASPKRGSTAHLDISPDARRPNVNLDVLKQMAVTNK